MGIVNYPLNSNIISNILTKEKIDNFKLKTEYQPLISTKNEEIYAYEALARFDLYGEYISAQKVFETAHKDLDYFLELEIKLKKIQFKNRVKDKKLFINFDPHVLLKKEKINTLFDIFSKQEDFVIEIVENSHLSISVKNLVELLKNLNYKFAVDDFFKENSMISVSLLNSCDYLKLDKDILAELKRNDIFFHIVDGIIKFAHNQNKRVVLEGVETQEDFLIAKRRGIDLVQGFYFRDKFILR